MAKLAAVHWNGLDTFMDELRLLAADLTTEAEGILLESAQAARADIVAAYPERSGALRRGVVIRPSRGVTLAGAQLVQTAPHAYIYEHGTNVRENSAGQNRGRMQPTPTFEPIAAAYHRTAITDVIFRLYQHGASRVTRDADVA